MIVHTAILIDVLNRVDTLAKAILESLQLHGSER